MPQTQPDNMCVWQAFLLPCTNFLVQSPYAWVPCPHKSNSGRAEYTGQPSWKWAGYNAFPSKCGCHIIMCVRVEYAWLSAFDSGKTRDVKLTYLSGCRGRLVAGQPCCVMRLVTEHKVWTSVILMCNNNKQQQQALVGLLEDDPKKRTQKNGN